MKRDELIKTMTGWGGAVRGDAVHKQIVDAYNSFLPHPRGYKLTYSDDYCAATVSAAAILCGLTDKIPVECSCGEQMRWYADVLRDLMDRYDQQNAQNTAYEREDADNARAYAYKTAMQLLQSGSMASDELLESAGISKADAQAMVAAVAAQKATAVAAQKATAKSSGRTTTPSKTRAAVSREILLSNGYDEDAWRDLEAYYGLTRDRIAQADPELAAALQMSGRTAPSEAEQLAARDKNFATWLNEANRLAEGGTSVQRLAEILQSWIALGRITQEQGNIIAATFGY